MIEQDDTNKCDSVSMVSCSTRLSDVTQDMDIPNLHRTKENIKIGEEMFRSFKSDRITKRWMTDGSDMSPLVPIQLTPKFTQKSPPIEDSGSEMSELLIPLVSNNSFTTVNKSKFEIQESEQIEESQSLLPQVLADSCSNSYMQSHNNREKGEWTSKQSDKMKASAGNSKNTSNDSKTIVTPTSLITNNDIRLSQTTVISSQNDGNIFSQKMNHTRGNDEVANSQAVVFASQEDVMTFSQVDNAFTKNAGELNFSHLANIPTQLQGKDPATRIISRLDRLVTSFDKVSSRQKMVIEATIVQCITSLQDSLNNKLKKQRSTKDNDGIYRKLLQTSQSGLQKVTEQQRLEKIHLTQSGTQSVSHNTQKLNQSALTDFGKRQKKVFGLLKRQKYLVDLFKERKRLEVATDHTCGRVKANQVLINTTDKKPLSESENNQPCNSELVGNQASKLGPRTTIDKKCSQKKVSNSKVKDSKHERTDDEIAKASVELGKQVQNMRKSCKDSKLRKDNLGDQNKYKDISGKGHVAKVYKDGYTEETNEVSDVVTKNVRLDKLEDCLSSEDLTTVPDTQEIITQNSLVRSSSDIRDDVAAALSDNDISEYSADEGEELVKYGEGNSSKMNKGTRVDQIEEPAVANLDTTPSKACLKRDICSSVKTDETVKKSKLIDKSEAKLNTSSQHNKLKTSEVLWLNMVREDHSNKPEPELSSNRMTVEQNDESKVVPKRLVKEPENFNKTEAQQKVEEKSSFQFIKPNLTKKINMLGAENKFINSVEQKEFGSVSVEKTDKYKEQTDEPARGEAVDSNVKMDTAVVLSYPPDITLPGESWHNISPTATSMSSDVFMVKMKDIQKRMKRRIELSQNIEADKPLLDIKQFERSDSEVKEIKVKQSESFDKHIGNRELVKDTISEAIEAVIKKSRDMLSMNDSIRQRVERNLNDMGNIASCESPIQRLNQVSMDISTKKVTDVMETDISKKRTLSGLPTLRELILSGHLIPGKMVMSCFTKGKLHRASLTPAGKIRNLDGLVYITASQWVTTLTAPVPVKKRRAYEMVIYKGRSLLSICQNSYSPHNVLQQKQLVKTTPVNTPIAEKATKVLAEQGTQVDDAEILDVLPKMSDSEKRLNSLLSNCVVRLLTEHDFVSCDDLPDNFWTEDFSKVRLHKDIWDTVDSW